MIDLFANLESLSQQGLLAAVARRYALMLPEVYFTLGPFLPLFAALWVIASLQRQNELVPLVAAGESPHRLAWPLVLAGLLLAPLGWADRELLLPRLAPLRREVKSAKGAGWECPRPIPDSDTGEDADAGERPVGVLAPRYYSPATRRLHDVRFTLLDPRGGELRTALAAVGDHVHEGWLLRDGMVIDRRRDPGTGQVQDALRLIPPEGWLLSTTVREEDVEAAIDSPAFQSKKQIERQLRRTPGFRHLAVRIHERLTYPLAGIALLLVAVPITLRGAGGLDSFLRFLVCLLLGFGYFIGSALAYELGAKGALPPAVAAWGPLVACAAVGVALLLRDARRA